MQEMQIEKRKKTNLQNKKLNFLTTCIKQRYLILMALPAFIIVFVFNYMPMYGVIIAFKDYLIGRTIMTSPWVGLKWFEVFFSNPMGYRLLKNTVLLGVYSLVWGFPAPIILALLLNEIKREKFKKLVQTISYLPHFISVVIIVGMLKNFSAIDGLFNQIIIFFGGEPINFFANAKYFRTLFIGSSMWQSVGWGTIIYLAALSGVDVQQYEAATIDGANRWHKMIHITLPAIVPTISILFILNTGHVLNQDWQKVLLMYNPQIYDTADVINTYVFREGIGAGRYSYTTAIGLFMSVLSLMLIYASNKISKKVSQTSIW